MEFEELFVPPDLADDYTAGILTRLFGGIIPKLRGEGDAAIVGNWLETIFLTFNTFCLLAMLVVLSYTIYAMVFDTAADGKTFGQSADTKYTILRVLGGVIGFIPLAGGLSLAQVAFLWLVLQGSAFGDATWGKIATNMLSGRPLVSSTIERTPPNMEVQIHDFGRAYDTLVTGHLCGLNANRISKILDGNEDVGESDVTTMGGSGPMSQYVSGPELEMASAGWLSGGRQIVEMSYLMSFREDSGGESYSGRDNYCGGVSASDSYSGVSGVSGDLSVSLLASRAQQQFAHLGESVLPALSATAYATALKIYAGERDREVLLEPSRSAVYDATTGYLSGPATATPMDSSVVSDAHEELMNMVTKEGWMMAPVWQRGVAGTVVAVEMPGTTLSLDSTRDNRITDFLSGTGYRVSRGDEAMRDLFVKADADQDTWDELAPAVLNLPLPDAPSDSYKGMYGATGGSVAQQVLNMLYRAVFEVFSPVANTAEAGNFGFVDPMLQVQRQGAILSGAGVASLTVGIGVDMANRGLLGKAGDFLFGTGAVASPVATGATSLGVTLILAGFMMMVVVPLVPTVYFFAAVLNWLLQMVEAMFAIPLAILQLFTPSREATLIGNFQRVLLSVFSIFLRPFFLIVGLILAMMIISVCLIYLKEIFARLMFFDEFTGGSDDIRAIGFVGAALDGVVGIIKVIFFLAVYVLTAFLTVLYGSQLISEFGDYAMNLLGAQANRYNQAGNIADKTVLGGGLGYMGARSAGGLPGGVASGRISARPPRAVEGGGNRALPKD